MEDNALRVQLEELAAMCGPDACTSDRVGHTVLPIQETVATASPSAWRNLLVTAVSPNGVVDLIGLDGSTISLWHHSPLALEVGEPVGWHPVAGLLIGSTGTASVAGR